MITLTYSRVTESTTIRPRCAQAWHEPKRAESGEGRWGCRRRSPLFSVPSLPPAIARSLARALRNHGLPTTAACRRLRQAQGSDRDVGSQEKQGVSLNFYDFIVCFLITYPFFSLLSFNRKFPIYAYGNSFKFQNLQSPISEPLIFKPGMFCFRARNVLVRVRISITSILP